MLVILIFFVLLQAVVVALFLLYVVSSVISDVKGAPYVPLQKKYVRWLVDIFPLTAASVFSDLGSGDGRVVFAAARRYDLRKAVGYEYAPWPYWKSRLFKIIYHMPSVVFHHLDMRTASLRDADVIYLYLYPKLIDLMIKIISQQVRDGTVIVCPRFKIDCTRHPQYKLLREYIYQSLPVFLYQKQ